MSLLKSTYGPLFLIVLFLDPKSHSKISLFSTSYSQSLSRTPASASPVLVYPNCFQYIAYHCSWHLVGAMSGVWHVLCIKLSMYTEQHSKKTNRIHFG